MSSTVLGEVPAAVQSPLASNRVLFSLAGANLNVTTDQALAKAFSFTNHVIDRILITNASADLSSGLAAGGFYTAAAKAGVAVVDAAQVYTALTAATKVLAATLANTDLRTNAAMYLSLTTANGAPATADVYVLGWALT